jgi:hypothetical protein
MERGDEKEEGINSHWITVVKKMLKLESGSTASFYGKLAVEEATDLSQERQ